MAGMLRALRFGYHIAWTSIICNRGVIMPARGFYTLQTSCLHCVFELSHKNCEPSHSHISRTGLCAQT